MKIRTINAGGQPNSFVWILAHEVRNGAQIDKPLYRHIGATLGDLLAMLEHHFANSSQTYAISIGFVTVYSRASPPINF